MAATVAACLAAGDCRVILPPDVTNPFPGDPRVGPAVGGARAEVELLHPVGEIPGGWARMMEAIERAGRGAIVDPGGRPLARFVTARHRHLRIWARRGLAPHPGRRDVPVRTDGADAGWRVLRGPVRLEGRFAGWG